MQCRCFSRAGRVFDVLPVPRRIQFPLEPGHEGIAPAESEGRAAPETHPELRIRLT